MRIRPSPDEVDRGIAAEFLGRQRNGGVCRVRGTGQRESGTDEPDQNYRMIMGSSNSAAGWPTHPLTESATIWTEVQATFPRSPYPANIRVGWRTTRESGVSFASTVNPETGTPRFLAQKGPLRTKSMLTLHFAGYPTCRGSAPRACGQHSNRRNWARAEDKRRRPPPLCRTRRKPHKRALIRRR